MTIVNYKKTVRKNTNRLLSIKSKVTITKTGSVASGSFTILHNLGFQPATKIFLQFSTDKKIYALTDQYNTIPVSGGSGFAISPTDIIPNSLANIGINFIYVLYDPTITIYLTLLLNSERIGIAL